MIEEKISELINGKTSKDSENRASLALGLGGLAGLVGVFGWGLTERVELVFGGASLSLFFSVEFARQIGNQIARELKENQDLNR